MCHRLHSLYAMQDSASRNSEYNSLPKIYERETYICKYISFSNYDCYKILTFMCAYDLQSSASRTRDQTPRNMLNLW